MAFRHRVLTNCSESVEDILTPLLAPVVDNDNGSTVFDVVQCPSDQLAKDIPLPDDYALDKLLAANIPLQRVDSALLDNQPSEAGISHFVESKLKDDKSDNNNDVESDNVENNEN